MIYLFLLDRHEIIVDKGFFPCIPTDSPGFNVSERNTKTKKKENKFSSPVDCFDTWKRKKDFLGKYDWSLGKKRTCLLLTVCILSFLQSCPHKSMKTFSFTHAVNRWNSRISSTLSVSFFLFIRLIMPSSSSTINKTLENKSNNNADLGANIVLIGAPGSGKSLDRWCA